MKTAKRVVLCIGGFDPSGGAGILADLRAVSAAGSAGRAVLAAMTVQSSARVFSVRKVPRGWVTGQICALAQETAFGAVKTGLLVDPGSVREIARWYPGSGAGPLIVDPVMTAGDGTPLQGPVARRAVVRELLPLAALVTPNRKEAEAISAVAIQGAASMERAARVILELGPAAVLIKGGHLPGVPADLLCDGRRAVWFRARSRLTGTWHGLGCHLASAIAARLVRGDALAVAVRNARRKLEQGMRGAPSAPSGRRSPCWGSRGSAEGS